MPKRGTHRFAARALVLCLAFAACESPFGPGADRGDLRANEARWEREGFASYDITVQQLCFCGFIDSVRVAVRNGQRIGQEIAATGEVVPFELVYPAVPDLFDIVRDALQRDAHDLDVQYHPTLGYPTRIAIDYEENTIDEEVTWVVSSLVAR